MTSRFAAFPNKPNLFFFLQIGAADGKHFDPIHPYIKRFGWKGILVEPLADLFEMLKSNYRERPDLIFEKVAITEQNETRTISRVPLQNAGSQGVPEWAFAASTLVPEKTRFASENSPPPLHAALNSAVTEEEIDCLSLASLLAKHNVERIDVLQIDAEGYDANILRQVDFSSIKPSVINMEWQWLTVDEKVEVTELLKGQGYFLYRVQADMLASVKPLEQMIVTPAPPTLDSVPRYFPGVTGLICRTNIDGTSQICEAQPSQYQIARYHGMTSPLHGDFNMYRFLTSIDGQNSYRQIAGNLDIDEGVLLQWGQEMQASYILE